MPVANTYRLHAITFGSPAITITQIEDQSLGGGIASMIERTAGHHSPTFRANQRREPFVRFTTSQVETILSNVPVSGVSGTTCTLYLAKAADVSKAAGSVHLSRIAQEFLLFWESVNLPSNGKATVRCVAYMIHDGTNPMLTSSAAAALPAESVPNEYFGCGPWYLNNVLQQGIQSADIESGVRHEMKYAASEPLPTAGQVQEYNPNVRLTTLEAVNFSGSLGEAGVALNGTNGFFMFARKYSQANERFAANTSEHIKIKCTHGTALPQSEDGSGTDDANNIALIEPVSNTLAVLPIVFTADQAIATEV